MSQRLVALDVFRGATIAAMILVNNPGSWAHIYGPLRHADWHGWTPTDLVFPFFVFIVGVAVVVARPKPVTTILRRGAVLWLLGLLLAAFPILGWDGGPYFLPHLKELRVLGVLPRLGICYAATALLVRTVPLRGLVILCAGILLAYWIAMAGYGNLDSKSDNLAGRIDHAVLGVHVWSVAKTWDPEGILSTFPALVTCLLGTFAGKLLTSARSAELKTLDLFLLGAPLVVAGWTWGLFFPINQPIWTSSYVLLTAGQASCALALSLHVCDVKGWQRWSRPFQVFGVNPITAFVGSGLLARTLGSGMLNWHEPLYRTLSTSWLPPRVASLAWALGTVALWGLVLLGLDKRGIRIKV